MASDVEASCENDPNFAVICAFLEKFGNQCGLPSVDFLELQAMLENYDEVPPCLTSLFLKLLRRVKKSVKTDKWEKSLIAVCHNFSSLDAWEIERFGYKKAKLSSKVRVLKELLEMQFDHHVKFKNEINKLAASELRSQPLGRDKAGHAYWFQNDENYQIRVYKEDLDEETWTLIAKDRESLVSLITKLNDGDSKSSSESAVNEDSNSLSDKPIIDTGQNDSDTKKDILEKPDDSVEKQRPFNVIEEKGKEQEENAIPYGDMKEKVKPMLRIKCLSELLDTTAKRSRFSDDDEEDPQHPVKIRLKKFPKEPIVGDEIVEPVMKIEGEGSGKENNSTCTFFLNELHGNFDVVENFIVGDAIEEDVLYVQGEGSGAECLTGNDELASTSKTQSTNILNIENNCENPSDSINNSLCKVDKEIKEAPSCKLGTTSDDKTDNNISNFFLSPTETKPVEENCIEKDDSADNNTESRTPPKALKKNMFFFGSTALKNTSLSPVSMGFGQTAPRNDTCDIEMNSEFQLEKTENNVKKKEIFETKEHAMENNIGNDVKSSEKCVINDVIKNNCGKEDDNINGANLLQSQTYQEKSVSQSDDVGCNKGCISDEAVPVIEELCIKKIAYVCGEKENEEENDESSELTNTNLTVSDASKKETKKNETPIVKIGNLKINLEKSINESKISKQNDSTIEEPISVNDEKVNNPETSKSETEISDIVNESNIDEEASEKPNNHNDFKPTDVQKSQTSLRSVRSKKVSNASGKQAEKPGTTPIEAKENVHTEIVLIKGRKAKTRKEQEVTVSPASLPTTKKPKLAKVKNRKEKIVLSTRTMRPRLEIKDVLEIKAKPGKCIETSTNSSRVSTPVSITESVITLTESVDSNSVDVVDKDPLADTDEESTDLPKPVNIQSISFDFNDSSTPPPIPVIPSKRTLRKRGRDASPEIQLVEVKPEKRMKMKGKRQVNMKLRKSIEQQKEQQVSSSDEIVEVSGEDTRKKSPKTLPKKKPRQPPKSKKFIDVSDDSSNPSTPIPVKIQKNKNKRILAGLDTYDDQPLDSRVRQSRRLAQIKIKEHLEPKKPESKAKEGHLKKKRGKEKDVKTPEKLKKDKTEKEITPEREKEPEEIKKRKKRTKAPNKIFDEHKPWKSSSESSEAEEEVEEEEEVIEEYYEPPLEFKSDHEFSPESDVASEGEYQPPKRARTARKKTSEEPEAEEFFPCQKCGKSDHPEWVLLCDKCDNGWHCSCLRPPLLGIPEGDWFCPPCQHLQLVDNLNSKLREYDKKLTKKSLEDRRKERLAYVGISLNNVLPTREQEHRKTKRRHSAEATESSSEESASSTAESESDDEPIYQLRQRRQARSYKFNEYDDLINSAIQDEMNEKQDTVSAIQSRGKDMSTIVKAGEEEGGKPKDSEQIKKDDTGKVPDGNLLAERKVPSRAEKVDNSDDEPIKPLVKTIKKKSRKICNLDVSSEEDDEKDEDFKGSSSGSEEEDDEELEEDSEEESDDYVRGGKRRKNLHPVRRSTRTRVCRYGADYVNDSDYEEAPKKKKVNRYWSESDSTESDDSWGKKKRKGRSGLIKRRKKKKKSILDELSDVEVFKKKKKPKIKYGLTSSEEEMGRGRRTRGKKMTYIDTLGSDSDEETRKRTAPRIDSDDENDEDFVANDEEEKDSEEVPEEDDDENKKDDEQESSSERRPLIIPKIYIKKPPYTKEIEKINERRISKGDINSKQPIKSETAQSSLGSKESELVVKDVNIEAKSETEKQKLEMLQKKDELKAEMKLDKNDEISKPSDNKTDLVNELNDKPKSNDEKPKVAEKVEIVNDQTKQISEKLKCVNEMQEKSDRFDLVEKQLASLHESQSSNEYKAVNLQSYENKVDELREDDFDLEENPIEQINKNLEEMDSDEMEKMMEEEYANKQLQLVALQIEKEKNRKERAEARQLEMASKLVEKPQPAKRGRKPKLKPPVPPVPPNASVHEPIVSNVRALIRNDDNNDELSEPPGVTLPLFDELAIRKSAEDMTKKRKGRGKGKKSLEEAVANLGGKRKETTAPSLNVCNIEIASNPQPFAQASPTPSVITRMLQSKPGQATTYPIGTIRPKQFATMPDDDDDSPGGSRDILPATGHLTGPPPGQFMPGEPRGIPYRQLPMNVNQYARGMLPPRQMRPPPSTGMVPHLYQPHRLLDPSPSGGGPINMVDTNQSVPTPCGSPKNEAQNYSRPPVNRFPPISTATSIAGTPPRPAHIMTHMQQPRHSNLNPYPQQSFYGGYPTDSGSNEDAMPPSAYQGPQYSEQYASEAGADPSENSNSKSFGGDESGGEFGGLVSYFSSQREDDLES